MTNRDLFKTGRQAFPLSRHDWICCLFFCQDQFDKKSMQSKKMNTLPIFFIFNEHIFDLAIEKRNLS